MHTPVLLKEVIKFLDPKPGKFVIDGTIDGGGHSTEVFEKISPNGVLLGVDWDERMIETAREKISISSKIKNQKSKLILVHGNYADLPDVLRNKNLPKADGLLLDLGLSSEQLEFAGGRTGRGFSFLKDEPLLMTYSDEREPVKNILRRLSEKGLERIIRDYGEEKFAARIAKAVKESEKRRRIETTAELTRVVASAVPKNYERGRIHPATRTFQALRIYVNDELGNLQKVVSSLPKVLKTGGRAVVISFHSLEDRLVKNNFRYLEKNGKIKILTKKPVTASVEELINNPRSRSAKLRAAAVM